ncbi:TetR family transcriptional regulator [Mycobacteroides abscessus]
MPKRRQVFAEVGYVKATIRGIAAVADVDKSSVTQYFGVLREYEQPFPGSRPVANPG